MTVRSRGGGGGGAGGRKLGIPWEWAKEVKSSFKTLLKGSRDGAVVRTLASHQCGSGSIPGLGVISGLSLWLILVLAPRVFSLDTPVFPSPQKNHHF